MHRTRQPGHVLSDSVEGSGDFLHIIRGQKVADISESVGVFERRVVGGSSVTEGGRQSSGGSR